MAAMGKRKNTAMGSRREGFIREGFIAYIFVENTVIEACGVLSSFL